MALLKLLFDIMRSRFELRYHYQRPCKYIAKSFTKDIIRTT